MDPEEKSSYIRILETATGTVVAVAVVVIASATGINAYNVFEPGALEAQVVDVSAQNAPVASTNESTACTQAKVKAAARGYGDGEEVITDSTSLQFEDQCIAAILNPALTQLSPTNPASYICVGRSATTNVNAAGVVTDTSYPSSVIPPGTCTVTSCEGATCLAAKNVTAFSNSTSVQSPPAITPDNPVTLPAEPQPSTVDVPTSDVSANTQTISGVSSDAQAPVTETSATEPLQDAQTQYPNLTQTGSIQEAAPPQTNVDTSATANDSFNGSGQPTFANVSNNTNALQEYASAPASTQPEGFFQKIGTTMETDSINAINDVRSFFGFSPFGTAEPTGPIPANIGIRG